MKDMFELYVESLPVSNESPNQDVIDAMYENDIPECDFELNAEFEQSYNNGEFEEF